MLLNIYWNILTMHGSIKVKSPNNISEWQMGFNSAFKRLNVRILHGFVGGLFNTKSFRARCFIYTVKTEIQNKNLEPKTRKFWESWSP
jgi:hypothetical protein